MSQEDDNFDKIAEYLVGGKITEVLCFSPIEKYVKDLILEIHGKN